MIVQVLTIIGSVLGGGALLRFIEFLITRKDKKNKQEEKYMDRFRTIERKIDNLDKKFDNKIDAIHKEMEYESANNARIRILTFSEEIQRGHKHSKESFDQIHNDIDQYVSHCNKYPEYPNSRADMAIKHIEDVYLEALQLEKEGYTGFLS